MRRLSPGSNQALNINLPTMVILAAVLCVLAGFGIVRFLLNFDQLQRLGEEYSSRAAEAPPSTQAAGTEVVSLREPLRISTEPTTVAAWLAVLNRYRAIVGVAPVTADALLSRGDSLHSHYLAINYAPQLPHLRLGADAHTEDPAKPGFTPEGAAAAHASDIDWSWDPRRRPKPSWAIGNWMQVPFHRMQIISPYLRKVGYGTYCQGALCFAALNTGTGIDSQPPIPSAWPKPLIFPADGSVIDINQFSDEWPDPLTSCHDYTPPAGLPISLELGHLIVPGFSDYSIRNVDDGALIEACAFDANTYANPDTSAQTAARAVLRNFGAIIIVPRRPLPPSRYKVTLSAGQSYTWSFSVVAQKHE
jgi:hypothetical protein